MTFGEVLRELRKSRGIGIKPLARQLGIDYTYLSKLENNKAFPSVEIIRRIAEHFDYDLEKLLLQARRPPNDILDILAENADSAPKLLRSRFSGRDTVVKRMLRFLSRLRRG